MKKRLLACVLAVFVVLAALPLSMFVSAETVSTIICACDTLTGWTKVNAAANNPLSVTTVRAQAQSDDGAIAANTGCGLFKAYYEFPEAVDITGYTAIEWDAAFTGTGGWAAIQEAYSELGYVRIFSNGNSPANNQSNSLVFRFDRLEVTNINGTWAHLKATISNPTVNHSFDPSAVTAFRFYTSDGSTVNTVPDGAVRLDNIMVTGKEVAEEIGPSETLVLSDGSDAQTRWSYRGNAAEKNDNVGNPGACVHAAPGYGALREMVFTPESSVDMSGRTTIEWDMCVILSADPYTERFETVKASYENTMSLTVSDGTNTAVIPVSEWEVGDTDYRYRTFRASLADRGLNLQHITSFTWVALPANASASLLDTQLASMFYRFDNVKATDNEVLLPGVIGPSETLVLSDGSDAQTRWNYRGNAAEKNDNAGNPGACVHAAPGYGALREMVFTPESSVDMSGRTTIEWDMCVILSADPYTERFETVKASYENTMSLTVSDGTNTAVIPVSEWEVGDTDYRYRTFRASLADRGLNLQHITSFTWVALPANASASLLDTQLPSMLYRFDNVKATANEVTLPSEPESIVAGHSVTLNGLIDLNFYMNLTEAQITEGEGTVVTFTWEKGSYSYRLKTTDFVAEKGYKAPVQLPAAEMNYQVTATTTINGVEQAETDVYSVREYALAVLASADPEKDVKLINLINTMLDYGAKAQDAFGRTDVPYANEGINYTMSTVTTDMIDEAISLANGAATADDLNEVAAQIGGNYYSSSLVYLSGCTLRHYFTGSSLDKNAFDGVKSDYYYYVETTGIAAADLDKLQEFTVGGTTFRWSALDFVKAIMSKYAPGTANYNLAAATYWYNNAANAYFG